MTRKNQLIQSSSIMVWIIGALVVSQCVPLESEDENKDSGSTEFPDADETADADPIAEADGLTDRERCKSIKGSYQIGGSYEFADEGFRGEDPWVYFFVEEGVCVAVFAAQEASNEIYDVRFTNHEVVLTPAGNPVRGGTEYISAHGFTFWDEIRLARDSEGLTGAGEADVRNDNDHECYRDIVDVTLEINVTETEAGTLTERVGGLLPWRPITIVASRPVDQLASHLELPGEDWIARDGSEPGAPGIQTAQLIYSGEMADVIGQSLSIPVDSELTDLSGDAFSTDSISVDFLDIPPAAASFDMRDMSGLATWGNVKSIAEGHGCAESGCLVLDGLGEYAGVAGLLDTAGMDFAELKIVSNKPFFYRIEFVGQDGTHLEPIEGGSSTDWAEKWVYDVSEYDLVGFSLEATDYGNGFSGEPLVVERVSTFNE